MANDRMTADLATPAPLRVGICVDFSDGWLGGLNYFKNLINAVNETQAAKLEFVVPAFAGLNTHQRAIAAGCRVAGATVHWVTAELDDGQILAQAMVPVLPMDTADVLAARVLVQEHLLYPQAVRALLLALTKPADRS